MAKQDDMLAHNLAPPTAACPRNRSGPSSPESSAASLFERPQPKPVSALCGRAHARGNREELKEYSLGVEVFDRGEAFDPRTDTIVRVQARRLRSKLKDYYDAEGQTIRSLSNCQGALRCHLRLCFLQEHGSTLHLIQSLEAHRNQIDGVPIEAASTRLPSLPRCARL